MRNHELNCVRRTLRRSPIFTATFVLTLALGIGAATAIFGAEPSVVLSLVSRDGVTLVAIGLVMCLVSFLVFGRFLRTLLFGVSATDPMTLLAVVSIIVIVAALASWLPAWRASRIDSLEALRLE